MDIRNIAGNVQFRDDASLEGTVTGEVSFNDRSALSSGAVVKGDATFSDESRNNGGYVEGIGVFNDTTVNAGFVDTLDMNEEAINTPTLTESGNTNFNKVVIDNAAGGTSLVEVGEVVNVAGELYEVAAANGSNRRPTLVKAGNAEGTGSVAIRQGYENGAKKPEVPDPYVGPYLATRVGNKEIYDSLYTGIQNRTFRELSKPVFHEIRKFMIESESPLIGWVPATDGYKYGIRTGSVEEWAQFFTRLAYHETAYDMSKSCNINGVRVRASSFNLPVSQGGPESFGIFQLGENINDYRVYPARDSDGDPILNNQGDKTYQKVTRQQLSSDLSVQAECIVGMFERHKERGFTKLTRENTMGPGGHPTSNKKLDRGAFGIRTANMIKAEVVNNDIWYTQEAGTYQPAVRATGCYLTGFFIDGQRSNQDHPVPTKAKETDTQLLNSISSKNYNDWLNR